MFDEIRRNLSEAQKSADKLQSLVGWPIPPPNGTPPNDGCQPFDTVGRILDLEKQVAELRALLVGRE